MAEFTMYLKEVIENTDGHIGLDDYPIFDAAYRAPLNKKIEDHFLNREIGVETVDMFVFAVKRKMNEIMPLYNQFYQSQLLIVEPFITFDSSTESSNQAESIAENASTSNSVARTVQSDMPQTQLAGNEDYASSAADNVGESNNTGNANSSDSSLGSVNTRGFSGAMSDLLLRYRDTFLNIDMQIIAELEDCFMQLWSTGQEFSNPTPLMTYPFRLGWF